MQSEGICTSLWEEANNSTEIINGMKLHVLAFDKVNNHEFGYVTTVLDLGKVYAVDVRIDNKRTIPMLSKESSCTIKKVELELKKFLGSDYEATVEEYNY